MKTTETEGARRIGRGEIDICARDDGLIVAYLEDEIGKLSAAREDIAADGLREPGTRHGPVVGGGDGVVDDQEGGSGIGDTKDVSRLECSIADSESRAGEFPESSTVIDRCVGEGSYVFASVDEAEVVGSWFLSSEISGEEGFR